MEILVSRPEDVILEVTYNNVLVDPDELPTVTIEKNSTTRLGTATKVAVGKYKTNLLFSEVESIGVITVTWSFIVSGETVSRHQHIYVMPEYSDLDSLIEISPDTASLSDVIEASNFARVLIETVTHQKFYPHERSVTVRGSGTDRLYLPARVISVSKVARGQLDLLDEYDYGITDTNFAIKVYDPALDPDLVATGMLFPRSERFQIDGVFGWEHVPENVTMAHKLLVNDWFCGDTVFAKKYVKNQKAADWSSEFLTLAFKETGNSFADRLLAPYVHRYMAVI